MTVASLFGDLRPGAANVALASEQEMASEAQSLLRHVQWTATSAQLLPEVARLLDVPLPALLIRFWQTSDEIAVALERSRRAPDDPIDVSIGDAATEAVFEPYIEVRVGGVVPGRKLPIRVVLPITCTAVVLRLENGTIADATAGRCEVGGSVRLGGATLARLTQPLTFTLGRGFLDHARSAI